MAPKRAKPIDFIITTSDPNGEGSAANKKRVRSVAALKSWPQRRKRNLEQGERSTKNEGQGMFSVENPDHPRPSTEIASVDPTSGFVTETTTATDLALNRRPFPSPVSSTSWSSSDLSLPDEDFNHTTASGIPCPCPVCLQRQSTIAAKYPAAIEMPLRRKRMADGLEKVLPSHDMFLITPPHTPSPPPSAGRTDPFNCYPVAWQPWFDLVLHHMMTIYAPRAWPAFKITNEEGYRWERYMTLNSLADPALFYVRLLYGSGDLINNGVLRPEIMFWLRAQAVKAINDAIQDPKRAYSDPLILAVGRIALHESLYGDKVAALTIHRPAHKRMIEMRGGMAGLDFPPLVKRLMRWADKVMALQSDTAPILEDDDASPNFTIQQSVDGLEKWVPKEGQTLRNKIKISDLLNDGSGPTEEG